MTIFSGCSKGESRGNFCLYEKENQVKGLFIELYDLNILL